MVEVKPLAPQALEGIGKHLLHRSDALYHTLHGQFKLVGVRRSLHHITARDQLAALAVHHRLRVVGLLVTGVLALSHEGTVGIGQVDPLRTLHSRPGTLASFALPITTVLLPMPLLPVLFF